MSLYDSIKTGDDMKILYEKATLNDVDAIINMQNKLNMMLGLNEDSDANCLRELI